MTKVLFVQRDQGWLKKFRKFFNGNYTDTQFDFRKSPRSALGRFICGQRYDYVMIDYGWSVAGLKKQIRQISPQSNVYIYSQMTFPNQDVIKKDVSHISRKLRQCGAK